MAFAILRTEKIKTMGKLKLANNHNASKAHRPESADPSGDIKRIHGDNDVNESLKRLLKDKGIKKPRKNAVLAYEFVATFSPEATKGINLDKWIAENKKFFEKKYGDRLLALDLHLDETTPHLHAIVAPIVQCEKKNKPKLSARDMYGGTDGPKKLRRLQDEYANMMAGFNLKRGIKGSKARHKDINKHHAAIKQDISEAKEMIEGFLETEPTWVGYGTWKQKIFDKLEELTIKAKHVFRLEDELAATQKAANKAHQRAEKLTEQLDNVYKMTGLDIADRNFNKLNTRLMCATYDPDKEKALTSNGLTELASENTQKIKESQEAKATAKQTPKRKPTNKPKVKPESLGIG